jgi:tetratricopeptide (TPR) repeat protein
MKYNALEEDMEELIKEAEKLLSEGNFTEAAQTLYTVFHSLTASDSPQAKPLLAHALNMLGAIFHASAEYRKATEATRESAKIYRELGSLIDALYALHNLLMPLGALDQKEEMGKVCDEIIGLLRELKAQKATLPPMAGSCLADVAYDLFSLDRVQDAHQVVKEAIAILEGANETGGLAQAYALLSRICHKLGKKEEEKRAVLKAVELSRKAGESPLLVNTLLMAAGVMGDRGEWREAVRLSQEAVEVSRHLNLPEDLGQALHIHALALFVLQRFQEALASAQEALSILLPFAEEKEIADMLAFIGFCCEALGLWDKAYTVLKESMLLHLKCGEFPPDFATSLKAYAACLLKCGDEQGYQVYIDVVNEWLIKGGKFDPELTLLHAQLSQRFGG